jgi:drug/metabolite transporter (DMT)-like permease
MIIAGMCITAAVHSGGMIVGHLILILTGGMWAAYAFIIRSSRIPALPATAIVAVGSAVLYLPIYIFVLPHEIAGASAWDIGLQVGVQGVLVSLAAVYAFSRSIELLGLTIGAALPALIPLVSLGLGFVFLGEQAGYGELLIASVIGLGVALILTAFRG